MSVLNRKLFSGDVVNSRGTGITSGLVDDTPSSSELDELFKERQEIYSRIAPPKTEVSRLQAASPALLALGSALLSGRSLQGGISGALDILGQAGAASAPLFDQAIKTRRAAEQANLDRQFQLDMAALSSAEDILATKAKGKAGQVKAAYIPNPNFDSTKPVSADNLEYIETTMRVGTDGMNRIRDVRPGSPTFNELISEDNFKGYLISDPYKKGTKKEGDVYVLNDQYKGKDSMNMYFTTQFKTDEFGNTSIKDPRPGSETENEYIPMSSFGQITFDKPKEEIESEKNKIEIAKVKVALQDLFNDISDRANVPKRELSEKELNLAIQQTGIKPGEWSKFNTGYGTVVNEAAEILKQFMRKDISPELTVEFGDKDSNISSETKQEIQEDQSLDYIDKLYNLNPSDINYQNSRKVAEDRYADRDDIPTEVQGDLASAFSGFKDLQKMADNIDVGIYKIGEFKRITAGLGLDRDAAEFLAASDGLLVSATSAMIKGVPSDFDVLNLKRIIPSLGKGDVINTILLKRLERVFADVVKSNLAFNSGLGFKIPLNIELQARELLGNPAVDEILATNYTEMRIERLKAIGSPKDEGYEERKKEYIKDFGDPLKRSLDILKLPDSAFENELTQGQFEDFLRMMDARN